MRIKDVIRRKGDQVVTVTPDTTVAELLGVLVEHGIGAVVVTSDDEDGGDGIVGIVSERDVVRHLHAHGGEGLASPVRDLMTTEVHTCGPGDHLDTLARTMTEHRVRHLPVISEGRMVAIVSIGDIVKHRIDELQTENEQLSGYIQR